jgi:hypothetical protein
MHESAGLAECLATSALAQAMRGWLWLYPIVEIIHIIGFVMLVGAVTMFDLRVLGLSPAIPVRALAHHLLRWSIAGLLLVVPAGLLMFSAHPMEFAENRVFQLKLALIIAAGVNAALFHAGVYRTVPEWDLQNTAPTVAKLHAALSIALWIAVIACGRLLAYT